MAYWKEAKSIVEVGNAKGWGKVIEIPEKKDRFGIGYQLSLGGRDVQARKGKILLAQ